MEYGGDRYGVQLERLSIDRNFNPEVGFLRRSDLRKNFALLRFSPRSTRIKRVRKFALQLEHAHGERQTRLRWEYPGPRGLTIGARMVD